MQPSSAFKRDSLSEKKITNTTRKRKPQPQGGNKHHECPPHRSQNEDEVNLSQNLDDYEPPKPHYSSRMNNQTSMFQAPPQVPSGAFTLQQNNPAPQLQNNWQYNTHSPFSNLFTPPQPQTSMFNKPLQHQFMPGLTKIKKSEKQDGDNYFDHEKITKRKHGGSQISKEKGKRRVKNLPDQNEQNQVVSSTKVTTFLPHQQDLEYVHSQPRAVPFSIDQNVQRPIMPPYQGVPPSEQTDINEHDLSAPLETVTFGINRRASDPQKPFSQFENNPQTGHPLNPQPIPQQISQPIQVQPFIQNQPVRPIQQTQHAQPTRQIQPVQPMSTFNQNIFLPAVNFSSVSLKNKMQQLRQRFQNLPQIYGFDSINNIQLKDFKNLKPFFVNYIREMRMLTQQMNQTSAKLNQIKEIEDSFREKGLQKVQLLKKCYQNQLTLKNGLFECEKILNIVTNQERLFKEVIAAHNRKINYQFVDPDQGVVLIAKYLEDKWKQLNSQLQQLQMSSQQEEESSIEALESQINYMCKISADLSDLQQKLSHVKKLLTSSKEPRFSALLKEKVLKESNEQWKVYSLLKESEHILDQKLIQIRK